MQERKPGCICELDPKTGEPIDPHYGECIVHRPDAPDPKTTAKKLIDKMTGACCKCSADGVDAAKECVDEILNVLEPFQRHEYAKVLIPFYRQVKKEIETT